MDFDEKKISFGEADRRFDELTRRFRAGEINDREFDDGRKRLTVRDEYGRWWAKSAATGEWRTYDNGEWKPGVPPGYDSPGYDPPPPQETAPPHRASGSSGSERISEGAVVREKQPVEARRRGFGMWAVLALGVAAVAVGAFGFFGLGYGRAYALVEDDSGNLSAEVPSDWSDVLTEDSEGEKGRDSWTKWLGSGEPAGISLTAVNGLDGWRTGADGHQGVYMVASRELTEWEDEYLVEAGPNDYWETCEGGKIQNFDRGEYSGKILRWKNCGGESGHEAVTLAASPDERRECVVVMQIGGYFRTEEDEAKIQNILETFEANCAGV